MNPKLRTSSILPQLRGGGRAVIENANTYEHHPGEPVGLLMALTYSEILVPSWTKMATFSKPIWGFNQSLTAPAWAK